MNSGHSYLPALEEQARFLENRIQQDQAELNVLYGIIARYRGQGEGESSVSPPPAPPVPVARQPEPEAAQADRFREEAIRLAPPILQRPEPIPEAERLARFTGAEYEAPDWDLSHIRVNFNGTFNVLDRLVRIGEAAPEGQLLNLTEVTRLMIAAGVSSAKMENLRTNIGHTIRDNPDIFERVGNGFYLYHRPPDGPPRPIYGGKPRIRL